MMAADEEDEGDDGDGPVVAGSSSGETAGKADEGDGLVVASGSSSGETAGKADEGDGLVAGGSSSGETAGKAVDDGAAKGRIMSAPAREVLIMKCTPGDIRIAKIKIPGNSVDGALGGEVADQGSGYFAGFGDVLRRHTRYKKLGLDSPAAKIISIRPSEIVPPCFVRQARHNPGYEQITPARDDVVDRAILEAVDEDEVHDDGGDDDGNGSDDDDSDDDDDDGNYDGNHDDDADDNDDDDYHDDNNESDDDDDEEQPKYDYASGMGVAYEATFYYCIWCSSYFLGYWEFAYHYLDKHPDLKVFCMKCQNHCETEDELDNHGCMGDETYLELASFLKREFSCVWCATSHFGFRKFIEHYRDNHPKRWFCRNCCNFFDRDEREQHICFEQVGKLWEVLHDCRLICIWCGQLAKDFTSLCEHYLLRHNSKWILCYFCFNFLSSRDQLRNHPCYGRQDQHPVSEDEEKGGGSPMSEDEEEGGDSDEMEEVDEDDDHGDDDDSGDEGDEDDDANENEEDEYEHEEQSQDDRSENEYEDEPDDEYAEDEDENEDGDDGHEVDDRNENNEDEDEHEENDRSKDENGDWDFEGEDEEDGKEEKDQDARCIEPQLTQKEEEEAVRRYKAQEQDDTLPMRRSSNCELIGVNLYTVAKPYEGASGFI